MEQEQTFEIEVKKDFFFGKRKNTFYARITLDVETTARFFAWNAWQESSQMEIYEEYLKKNLEAMKLLVARLWIDEGFIRFVEGLQEDLADFFEDEIDEQVRDDDDFKRDCYDKCACAYDAEEYGGDYLAWWENEGF